MDRKFARRPQFSRWFRERSGKVEVLPTSTVAGWFEDVLGNDDPKPSHEQCEFLAREFRLIINRTDNAEAALVFEGEKREDLLRDVQTGEEERRIVEEIGLVGKRATCQG